MRRARKNPILEHESLVRHAVLDRARGFSLQKRRFTLARSFDDGRPLKSVDAGPGPINDRPHAQPRYSSVEYDVARANPDFDETLYEVVPHDESHAPPPPVPEPAAGTTRSPPRSSDVLPSEVLPSDPGSLTAPQSLAAPPAAMRSVPKSRASENGSGSAARSYVQRQMDGLVRDEELRADIAQILGDKSKPPPASDGAPARGKPATPAQRPKQAAAQSDPGSEALANLKPEHAIFDKIAQNMRFASAYDLGSVDLDRRFERFDQLERRELPVRHRPVTRSPSAAASRVAEPRTRALSLEPDGPPRPTQLRPYTTAEKSAVFGTFQYEPDPNTFGGDGIRVLGGWVDENIVNVSIPQLNGKRLGDRVITNGSIRFHRLGQDALVALWAEWESAGLLDRVLTFHGGHAARFIRGSADRNPRPLSNHALGTAFDINAAWNGFGRLPALVGAEGSVRELVEIANRHGFFWGGHFRGRPDGMHFELAKSV